MKTERGIKMEKMTLRVLVEKIDYRWGSDKYYDIYYFKGDYDKVLETINYFLRYENRKFLLKRYNDALELYIDYRD